MSRSYRAPYVVDGYGSKRIRFYKRLAGKRVRKNKDLPSGGAYKKGVLDDWDFRDYKYHQPGPSETLEKIGGEWEWIPLPWNKWGRK